MEKMIVHNEEKPIVSVKFPRKDYIPPKLISYGNISELTRSGSKFQSGDTISGLSGTEG